MAKSLKEQQAELRAIAYGTPMPAKNKSNKKPKGCKQKKKGPRKRSINAIKRHRGYASYREKVGKDNWGLYITDGWHHKYDYSDHVKRL